MLMQLTNTFMRDYCLAQERKIKNYRQIIIDNHSDFIMPKLKNKKVGYIVATASPATKAHIELADRAINDLGLEAQISLILMYMP